MRSTLHYLLLILAGAAFCAYSEVNHEIAVVTKIRGMVMNSYGENGKQKLTTRGELLFNRATLHTGLSGFVQVRFIAGGTTLFILPESRVLITRDGSSEMVNILAGKAFFEGQAVQQGSLDISTPATITTTPSSSVSLVTHDEESGNSALFITGGSSLITDPSYSEWRPFSAPSAVYVNSSNPAIHMSTLTPGDSSRLGNFLTATRSMKLGAPLFHTIIIQPDSGGRVIPGDTMTALQGYAVEIAAKPQRGYVFTRWEALDGAALFGDESAESTTVYVTTDTRVAARFTNNPAKLLIESLGAGMTTPQGTTTVPRYRPWKVTAQPIFGHTVEKWTATPGIDIVTSDSISVIVMVNSADGRLTAEFERRKFILDVSATQGGSVSPGMNAKIASGDSLRITAVPDKGYSFIKWETVLGRAVINNPYAASATVKCDSGNAQIQARFNKSGKTAKITINPHECAEITPVGTILVPRGEPFTLSTRPKKGYELKQWLVRFGSATVSGTDQAVVRAQTNGELVAEIVTRKFNLNLTAKGPGSTSPSGTTKSFYNVPVTIAAQPQEGKKFASWEIIGGDATIADKNKPTTTVTLSSTDALISAAFAAEICTLMVDATMGGYVEPADTQIMYEGKTIGLKAVPNPRAAFLGWSLDTGGKTIELSDTVTAREQILTQKKIGNAKITARFSTKTVELTILNNGLGATSPVKSLWIPQEQWMPLKAEPTNGNKFLHWVIISGAEIEIRDQFSPVTELNPGTSNATIKALFDTSSGYESPLFSSAEIRNEYKMSMVTEREKGKVLPAAPMMVRPGVPQSITAEALPGYTFIEWIVREGDASISDRYNRSASVLLTGSDATIECVFTKEKSKVIKARFIGPKNQQKTVVIPYR